MDNNRSVRMVGACWCLLGAAVIAAWGGLLVGGFNDMYGDFTARYASPTTLGPGIFIALLASLPVLGARRLAPGSRAVRGVGVGVLVLALFAPMVATQGYIEWRRGTSTAESPAVQLEREAQEEFNQSAPEATVWGASQASEGQAS